MMESEEPATKIVFLGFIEFVIIATLITRDSSDYFNIRPIIWIVGFLIWGSLSALTFLVCKLNNNEIVPIIKFTIFCHSIIYFPFIFLYLMYLIK